MTLTPGRIVLYRLSVQDAEVAREIDISAKADEIVPAIVVRVWGDTRFSGQAFLDGVGSIWLSQVEEGDQRGQWQWPTRQ